MSERNDGSLSRSGLCCAFFSLHSMSPYACVPVICLVCIALYGRYVYLAIVGCYFVDLIVLRAGLTRVAINKNSQYHSVVSGALSFILFPCQLRSVSH